jgi:tetratricopeptide (TPR) repeat protein
LPVLLILAALPLTVREARADNESDAKAAYAKGREHFKAGKYTEAIVELKKAYALKPHPALLRYMGDTYYKMNKARLAIVHYKKYLKEAPEAPDKDKVEGKVRQLELIVGAGEEDDKSTPPPPPPPGPEPDPDQPTTTGTKTKIDLQPTGEDREVPTALAKRPAARATAPVGEKDAPSRGRGLSIAKWTALAVGVAGMAVGITFNALAKKKASELEDAARNDLPSACVTNPNASGCGGNPDLNTPVVEFNKQHYDLQQSYKTNNTIATASMIAGGALLATGVVLFIVDHRSAKAERRERRAGLLERLQIAPVVGASGFGLAGEVGF